jgi:hypothetical protein
VTTLDRITIRTIVQPNSIDRDLINRETRIVFLSHNELEDYCRTLSSFSHLNIVNFPVLVQIEEVDRVVLRVDEAFDSSRTTAHLPLLKESTEQSPIKFIGTDLNTGFLRAARAVFVNSILIARTASREGHYNGREQHEKTIHLFSFISSFSIMTRLDGLEPKCLTFDHKRLALEPSTKHLLDHGMIQSLDRRVQHIRELLPHEMSD